MHLKAAIISLTLSLALQAEASVIRGYDFGTPLEARDPVYYRNDYINVISNSLPEKYSHYGDGGSLYGLNFCRDLFRRADELCEKKDLTGDKVCKEYGSKCGIEVMTYGCGEIEGGRRGCCGKLPGQLHSASYQNL
ncbi:hypothetical protein EC973_007433 [Apophysomyces ossiformis]|uniref:Uncharacterized protein n=1 Tax=Apophysomyces ossiformis TaxID=679940 RepID=A0A8H7BU63_9FUNG|nr:hypothetical protein EC973_007396 [Apophysomyces ossiformis]KAF7727559.1 hypothetical protein EC973_007433 [Apophysomyces ossiformis]